MIRFKLTPPYLSASNQVSDHMLQLILALVPAILALMWFFGMGVLIQIIIASLSALLFEAVMLMLRHKPLKPFLTDGSALVTALLLAIAIPPLAPWWLTIVGVFFAIVFAKHLYGGLGYNPFNPAMAAYVLLLISFPVEMTSWLAVDAPVTFSTAVQVIATEQWPTTIQLDAVSAATPLDHMKTQLGLGLTTDAVLMQDIYAGNIGKGWFWVNLFFALGGLFLLYRKVIYWHIPVAVLSGLFIISAITWLLSPETTASPLFHLFSGGTMIGAFFIATDPVSGATTHLGRLIYGAGIGILTYIIRTWGGYPDGIAFAVLLMNMLVPLIDYYTQPRVYGS